MSHYVILFLDCFVVGSMILLIVEPRAVRVLVADVRDIYNDDDKRERLITFVLIGLFWAMCAATAISAANVLARFIPIEQRINHIQTYQKIEKIKQVYIPVPSNVKYPPLDDPKKACHGAPVFIVGIDVSGAQGQSKTDDSVNTWMTVRPAGDPYTVACYMPGDYSSHWHTGDLISMPVGKVSSEDSK